VDKKVSPLMEPADSLLSPQECGIGLHPEPVEIQPQSHILFI